MDITPVMSSNYVIFQNCPLCAHFIGVDYGDEHFSDDGAHMQVKATCLHCGATWHEQWKLTGISDLERRKDN